jgi:hypothetical protein
MRSVWEGYGKRRLPVQIAPFSFACRNSRRFRRRICTLGSVHDPQRLDVEFISAHP